MQCPCIETGLNLKTSNILFQCEHSASSPLGSKSLLTLARIFGGMAHGEAGQGLGGEWG